MIVARDDAALELHAGFDPAVCTHEAVGFAFDLLRSQGACRAG
eukprot:CAMPEP_0202056204 /NCGR_PEP_ID=MMETSP0963-20130614/22915_1 /ASSEMBLY_ACC=CAM_ASM_000494 /TAXON_ID=4773 /ORGANISM="Schizochytrium aggregatum, Strain ATCC28209" /LENGTH=42 /DNA_ID= /DNA_START= /DNA_END= /DNA_ORIENTATION=